jgi:hypothetical protein
MSKQEIEQEIQEYTDLINAEGVPQDEKDFAGQEIDKLKAKLAAMNNTADEPKKKGRPKTAKEKRPRKMPDSIAPGDVVNGVKIMDANGRFLDLEGNVLSIGDAVEFPYGGGTAVGTISAFAKQKGGGHSVSTEINGKRRGTMVSPNKVTKIMSVDFSEKMPKSLVRKVNVAGRADCDENEVLLVTPTQKVRVDTPQIADPANGDKIMVNNQGHPMAVVEGESVKTDYELGGTPVLDTGAKGEIVTVAPPEKDEKKEAEQDKQEKSDDKIKKVKPPKDCSFLKEDDEPALQKFLEGMRLAFREGDTSDKVERVMLRKSDSKIILQIKRYFILGMVPGTYYYSICLSTGKLTEVKERLAKDAVKSVMSQDAMRDFYRAPNTNTCRRVSRELHVTCYREGNCTDERKKRLIELFTRNCRKREDELTRSYRKYTHAETRKKYDSYEGDKSYAQIYSEVIASLKK